VFPASHVYNVTTALVILHKRKECDFPHVGPSHACMCLHLADIRWTKLENWKMTMFIQHHCDVIYLPVASTSMQSRLRTRLGETTVDHSVACSCATYGDSGKEAVHGLVSINRTYGKHENPDHEYTTAKCMRRNVCDFQPSVSYD